MRTVVLVVVVLGHLTSAVRAGVGLHDTLDVLELYLLVTVVTDDYELVRHFYSSPINSMVRF